MSNQGYYDQGYPSPYGQAPPPQQYQQYNGQAPYPAAGGQAPPPGQNQPYQYQQPYQQPQQAGPNPYGYGPPPQQQYSTPGYGGPPQYAQPGPPPPTYGQLPGSAAAQSEPATDKGVASKLAALKLSRRKSFASSSSSSGSDSDGKKHKHKHKHGATKFATPPAGNYTPYPFSPFCDPSDPETIVFEIADNGLGHDILVGPNQDVHHPAYKIDYEDSGFEVSRCDLPSLDRQDAVFAGKLKRRNELDSNLELKFPWGKWEFDVRDNWWGSDVGFLRGKNWMRWTFIEKMDTYKSWGFVVRCFDVDSEDMPTTASFIMKGENTGTLKLPARLFRTVEQLDESVVVAFAVMHYYRDYVRYNPDNKTVDNCLTETAQ